MKLRMLALGLAWLALHSAPAMAINTFVDPDAPCYRWPAVDMDGDGVFDRVDHCVSTPKGCAVDRFGCTLDGDGDGVCDGIDQCPSTPPGMKVNNKGCHAGTEAMGDTRNQPEPPKEIAKPAPTAQPVRPVSETERQLVEHGRIRLENVYFETNSANLLPESEATLNEVGTTLEKFPDLQVEIEGHTDTRGSGPHNMRLSQSRSESVRSYLLGNFRLLRADNLVAKGYGETRPETEEHNEEELLRNRRVVLRALNPDVLPRGVRVEQKE